jgi:TP901 family phage tail tape measure protein
MSSVVTQWILKLVDDVSGNLKNIDNNVEKVTQHTSAMNESLKESSAVNLTAIVDSAGRLRDQFMSAVEPGIKLESSLADVSAITGVVGDDLTALGNKARESAKIYGVDASAGLENYKAILSRLGPDIAQNQDALDTMNRNALILSKTMGGDTKGAVDALSTAMLQFRVDLSDPLKASREMTDMMNVMAAGAKEGAAEVPDISAALKVAGVAASQANVSFVETNAALQELARGGKKGAEGGIALRNILGKMAGMDVIPREAQEKLKAYGVDMNIVSDKTLPLTERLRELGKAQGDATLFAQMFGVENQAAASILVRSVDAQDALKNKITDTNTAQEQADIVMGTFAEKMKRWKSRIEDFGISFFSASKNFIPFIDQAISAAKVGTDIKNSYEGVSMLMNTKVGKSLSFIKKGYKAVTGVSWKFIKALGVQAIKLGANALGATIGAAILVGEYVGGLIAATAAQLGLNIAMDANPIGLIVLGIAAAVAAIVVMIKYWDEITAVIWKFIKFVWKYSPFKFIIDLVEKIFPGFKKKIGEIFGWVKDKIMAFWNSIKEVFHKVAAFFGFGDDAEAEVKVKAKVEKGNTNFSGQFATAWDGGKSANKVMPDLTAKHITSGVSGTKDVKPGTVSGTGGGSGKQLTMHLSITNIYKMIDSSRQEVEKVAEQVTRIIVDKLREGEIAAG